MHSFVIIINCLLSKLSEFDFHYPELIVEELIVFVRKSNDPGSVTCRLKLVTIIDNASSPTDQ
jgi:hypothetical protein